MDQVIVALIGIVPELVLIVFLTVLATRFREPLLRLVDQRVASVSALGVRVELRPADIEKAVQERSPDASATTSAPRVVSRAQRLAPRLAGRMILWVDDRPDGNLMERRMLRQMGITVESVTTNAAAYSVLEDGTERVDLVISDIDRAGQPDGLQLVQGIAAKGWHTPAIFYVGRVDPERPHPRGAFGITDRPDELLDLVMDALDRMAE